MSTDSSFIHLLCGEKKKKKTRDEYGTVRNTLIFPGKHEKGPLGNGRCFCLVRMPSDLAMILDTGCICLWEGTVQQGRTYQD